MCPSALAKYVVCYFLCSWADIQGQNEQGFEQEIEDIRRRIIAADNSLASFSDKALDEQKHNIRIDDEKVALAAQSSDFVCIPHTLILLSVHMVAFTQFKHIFKDTPHS